LLDAVRCFLPVRFAPSPAILRQADWFHPSFVKRHEDAFRGHLAGWKPTSARPSFVQNLRTLAGLQRQLACAAPTARGACSKTFPYLDRDFVEFVFALPREQLVRPGQRRSLMRRALAGIVPDAVLNRRRKAFVARAPLVALSAHRDDLLARTRDLHCAEFRI